MKKSVLISGSLWDYILSLIIGLIFLSSCNTTHFTTVNNMRNINGKIYLLNDTILEGNVTIGLDGSWGNKSYVEILEKGRKKITKVMVEDINEVYVRNNYYQPKIIDTGIFGGEIIRFLKRITKSDSKIQLFEYHTQSTVNSGFGPRSGSYNEDNFKYYVSLPFHNRYECFNINGEDIVPDMERKVSKFFDECPKLTKKIKNKEDGFYYSFFTGSADKKINIWTNIIEEYDKCMEINKGK
ncbi:MAG: hypothetical protein IPP06_02280 [Saprospiraceae bacterium]|nr:hypothetical protein [Candidatus Vicinibacter affinis]MBK7302017.1 hypothetical protein [Candidatus Vicinibacter affinis]MBK9960184.1 hypothetical protein [Candidatus Vicinibacter affinis]HQX43686.1 hypothetical protein [Saprospiraceae bacterium]